MRTKLGQLGFQFVICQAVTQRGPVATGFGDGQFSHGVDTFQTAFLPIDLPAHQFLHIEVIER